MLRASAVLLLPVCLAAQSLSITKGLVDYQVLQRDAQNRGAAEVEGKAEGADGRALEMRVTGKGGFGWRAAGTVQNGAFKASLSGIPVGGPYRIELRAGKAAAAVANVLVGDLWVLAGQSNMEGYGDLVNLAPPSAMVNSFDMTDVWRRAEEPLHRLVDAADSFHQRGRPRLEGEALKTWIANRKKGTGAGLPFALEMTRRTGVPIGLLPCAHGGTSMDQWSPSLKEQGGASLYGAMLRRVRAVGGKVAGVLWYQGESDTGVKSAPLYQGKFEAFIAAVREDFGQPQLPFYLVQLGRFVNASNPNEWNLVQEAERLIEEKTPRTGMAVAVDLDLDDPIHIGTDDFKRLGKRLANLACRDLFPNVAACQAVARGPRPVSAKLEGGNVIRVSYSNVNGGLRAPGRIAGFSLWQASGEYLPALYKAMVDPKAPAQVLLYVQPKLPEGTVLRYGAGKDPYCNLVDVADMAAPVFGPMKIE
ncbi:MAG TPA: sialate O-acetylesterase [Solibacterales bacterium]|nr:sialate O-acetylesterase [Bryobacterales bacterium]